MPADALYKLRKFKSYAIISGLVVVGDPLETGGHYGAAGSDEVGLKEGRALGKRVAELADLVRKK